MAKFSIPEFADHCGVSDSYVRMYIRRNKVFTGDDGLIDTALPMNADFMNARKEKKKAQIIAEATGNIDEPIKKPVKKSKGRPKKLAPKPSQLHETEDDGRVQQEVHKYNLDKQIKEAELEKKTQEIELNKLKIAKLSGEVIPTELVRDVFGQHFKSVTTAFHQGADSVITTIAKMAGMDRQQVAKMRETLVEIVNEAIRESVENSKQSVKNIVREYREKRGVGEKK